MPGSDHCLHAPPPYSHNLLQLLHADAFVEKPGKDEKRWTTPVLQLLHTHMASPEDIIAVNFGLWYDPKNPVRVDVVLKSISYVRTLLPLRFT